MRIGWSERVTTLSRLKRPLRVLYAHTYVVHACVARYGAGRRGGADQGGLVERPLSVVVVVAMVRLQVEYFGPTSSAVHRK